MNSQKLKTVVAFLLGTVFTLCFILLTSAKPEPSPAPPSSSGYLIGSGSFYKLYRHKDGGNVIYVGVTNSGGSVSVSK